MLDNSGFVGGALTKEFVGATPDRPVLIIVGVGIAEGETAEGLTSLTGKVLVLNVDLGTKLVVGGTLGASKSAERPVKTCPVAM